MKFLIITDLHQKIECIPWINGLVEKYGPEAVLCLGDVTDFGTGKDAADIISGIKCKTYAVPGNCDPRDFPEAVSSVSVDMHGKSTAVGNYRIVGLGGSNPSPFGTPFELGEEEIDSALRPVSEHGMILMTHAPGYDTFDHIPDGTPVGSVSIRKIIDEFEPVLAVSGHIHEDIGVKTVGKTVLCNPGPAMEKRAAIVELNGNKAEIELIGPRCPQSQ